VVVQGPTEEQLEAVRKVDKTTAYHEAGHAVVAFILGIRLERITIRPGVLEDTGDWYSGCVWLKPDYHAYADALVSAAGPMAQKLLGRPEPWKNTPDYKFMCEALADFNGNDKDGVKKFVETLAKLMCIQHWKLIHELAEKVLDDLEMEEEEVTEFLLTAHERLLRDTQYEPEPIFEHLAYLEKIS
jgi:hypothetical protein